MQDETDELKEAARLAALKEDLEKWEKIEKQKEENKLREKENTQQWIKERTNFLYESEKSRRNGPSLVPDGFREPPMIEEAQHADAKDRAQKQANLEYSNYCNAKIESAKQEFLESQKEARKLAEEQQKLEQQAIEQRSKQENSQSVEQTAQVEQFQQGGKYAALKQTHAQVVTGEQIKQQEQSVKPEPVMQNHDEIDRQAARILEELARTKQELGLNM